MIDSDDITARYDRDGYCFPLEVMSPQQAAHYRGLLEKEVDREFSSEREKSVFFGRTNYVLPFMDEITKAHGLGWQTGERWKVTQQILVDQGIIKNPVGVGTLFTKHFLKDSPKM